MTGLWTLHRLLMANSRLKSELIYDLTKPTERDKQHRAGPSDLGNPCPKCLGRKLAGEAGQSDFSLYPWLGTAVHAYLETQVFQDESARHEIKVEVGEVAGYGPIKGTSDLVLQQHPELGSWVVDWKIVGLKKIKEYRVKGAPDRYRYQGQLYARGCELAGFPVDSIGICFIPRDSGNVNDIWIHEEEYQPEMAEAVLERAGRIFAIVQSDGWETLPSDDACWECSRSW